MPNLLLIDLDGTVRRSPSGCVCPTSPNDQSLIPETMVVCAELFRAGWDIVGITNQGGCEAINPATKQPYKTHRQAIAECKHLLKLARWMKRIYMCPNDAKSERDEVYVIGPIIRPINWYYSQHEYNGEHPYYITQGYRKPKPGMLELAIRDQHRDNEQLANMCNDPMGAVKASPIMVGDHTSDRQAAAAIAIPYLDVKDFQKGANL